MDVRPLHRWDATPEEAVSLQRQLSRRRLAEPPDPFEPRLVAGADLAIRRGDPTAHAAIVVVEVDGLETVAEASATTEVAFPYVPGLLSFRELPALAAAWERLDRRPDALIFDGHGYAHPRRFGLACHGGLLFDVPSVGCAKSVLVGEHEEPPREKGGTAELRDGSELVGAAVRTRTGVRPVFVSAGHRMDLSAAVETVLRVSPRYRIPEPVRRADRLAGELRRRADEASG